MYIENKKYKINIEKDLAFTINSTDNKPYDCILNPGNYSASDFYGCFSITIDDGVKPKRVALIGSCVGGTEDAAILEDGKLIVLMDADIIVIDCSAIIVKNYKRISDYCCFSIYEFCGGYIIYGEMDIIKLSSDFEIEWAFSGSDIFVVTDGSMPFQIENDTIRLVDWLGNKYHSISTGKR